MGRGDDLFQFGAFRLDAGERVLLRDGRLVPLPAKVLSTLILLVRNNGHVVEKDISSFCAGLWVKAPRIPSTSKPFRVEAIAL